MPTNNPTRDYFDPPSNMSQDFEEYYFGDLEVDELFWQTNRPEENNPWRKLNQTHGINLKTQKSYKFDLRTKVFQKI
jgi:hypothetical protein